MELVLSIVVYQFDNNVQHLFLTLNYYYLYTWYFNALKNLKKIHLNYNTLNGLNP